MKLASERGAMARREPAKVALSDAILHPGYERQDSFGARRLDRMGKGGKAPSSCFQVEIGKTWFSGWSDHNGIGAE
jgi:hypothetical protein